MNTKKAIWIIGGVIVLALLIAGLFYAFRQKVEEPEKKSIVGVAGAAEEVSKSVPAIVTNPAEKVPEVNPLDRANPFKYSNPLR